MISVPKGTYTREVKKMQQNNALCHQKATLSHALRIAPLHELDASLVLPCIYSDTENLLMAEQQFHHAFEKRSLPPPPARSSYLNGVIGKVAEDVTSILFVERHNWQLIGQDISAYPGSHGVDLLLLSPSDKLYAVEVKGTFGKSRWPRLSKGRTRQMTHEWLSKGDNPILVDWELSAAEIYGMVIYIHFGKWKIKGAVSDDFLYGKPIHAFDDEGL